MTEEPTAEVFEELQAVRDDLREIRQEQIASRALLDLIESHLSVVSAPLAQVQRMADRTGRKL
jgi:uncharacterized membrane protein